MYMHTHAHLCAYIHTHTYIYIHISTHTLMCVSTYAVLRGRRFRSNIEAYVEFRVTFSIVVVLLCVMSAAGGVDLLLPEQVCEGERESERVTARKRERERKKEREHAKKRESTRARALVASIFCCLSMCVCDRAGERERVRKGKRDRQEERARAG